jgi:F-type H+-transporting ATPase subunit b
MKVFHNLKKQPAKITSLTILMVSFFVFVVSGVVLASGGGEAGPVGWISTDTYRVINFVVLVVVLVYLLRKPVSQALKGRVTEIKTQLEDLEAQKTKAEKNLAEYKEKLSMLGQETDKLVAEYVKQGNEAKVRILKEAESAAQKLEQQAHRSIEHEFAQAKASLQKEIVENALVKAEEIIQRKITDKDQDRLVDEYLDKVVA